MRRAARRPECGRRTVSPPTALVVVLFLLTEVVEDFVLARAARLYPAESSISGALPVLTGAKFAVMALMGLVIAGCGLRLAWRKD